MEKKTVINHFGGYENTWKKLGYKSIQPVYNWPPKLSEGLMVAIIRRMKAERIDVPNEWDNAELTGRADNVREGRPAGMEG